MKRYIYVLIAIILIAGIVFGIAQITNQMSEVDDTPAVSDSIDGKDLDDTVENPDPIIEEEPIWYVDTTVVSMFDDINADAEAASSLWLNVNVAITGYFGGLDEDNISGFYLISNDMNYAFESIYCNMNYENILNDLENTTLDTCMVAYGEVISVNETEGYTINVERIEVKN